QGASLGAAARWGDGGGGPPHVVGLDGVGRAFAHADGDDRAAVVGQQPRRLPHLAPKTARREKAFVELDHRALGHPPVGEYRDAEVLGVGGHVGGGAKNDRHRVTPWCDSGDSGGTRLLASGPWST